MAMQIDQDVLRVYVVDHINQAIAKQEIRIYFQPVVRSLTEKLCGLEALSRWQSPKYGFLTPDQFIPVLEETGLIYQLDRFVIEEVAKKLRKQMDDGLPVVPVSVNISSMDFLVGHPFEDLEQTVKKYRLRKDQICFEITESALISDKERKRTEIARLHDNGYEVWMDDFGSGYSTLNVLKEFRFDAIKIDMMFLRELNEQGREILRSIVSMAKRLGIHTLTEGAETAEQVDFLKQIGCERIQGYYYCRPMSYTDAIRHCRAFGITEETLSERKLYDPAGLEDTNLTSPVGLFLDDGKTFTPLIVNEAYLATIRSGGIMSFEEMEAYISSPNSYRMAKLREFSKKPIASGKTETLTFADNGQYFRLNARTIAGQDGMYIHRLETYNITADEDAETTKLFDTLIRNSTIVYREIYFYDVEEDELQIIETTNSWEKAGDKIKDVARYFRTYAETSVYQEDRELFLTFINADHIHQITERNGLGFITQVFRIRQSDGNYKWVNAIAAINNKMPGKPILLLIREASLNSEEFRKQLVSRLLNSVDYAHYGSDGQTWSMDGEL